MVHRFLQFKILLLLFSAVFIFFNASAQLISATEKDSVITEIKKLVAENYVITGKVKIIADSLSAEKYPGTDSVEKFISKLNADLFRITNDLHLYTQYKPTVAKNLMAGTDIHAEQDKKEAKENFGFSKLEILKGNIGYLKLNYFADAKNAGKTVEKSISYFRKTKALIIDMRGNPGGSGSMIQLLCGYFLPDSARDILHISYISGRKVTMKADSISLSKKYAGKPVYILCNSHTFSAGEAFTFILQNRHRAVIVGEKTAGAGTVGGPYGVNENIFVNIPVGIIIDPVTNTGWEQKGVTPDIAVSSDAALDTAIQQISR